MKLNINRKLIKSKSKLFTSEKKEFEITWILELSASEMALVREFELEKLILINFFEDESSSKPIPIRVQDLLKGVTFKSSDVWWVLDCDKNLRQVCSDLLTLINDSNSFEGTEICEIKKVSVKL